MVYLLASQRNETLYCGMTGRGLIRIWEHRVGVVEGFTKQYGATRLVWFETAPSAEAALLREKQIKEWKRAWKIRLIEERNPEWIDLYPGLAGGG